MKTIDGIQNKEQLEIHFGKIVSFRSHVRPKSARRFRAQWWFQQMRRAVDGALDWRPAPPPRPEQIYLELARGR